MNRKQLTDGHKVLRVFAVRKNAPFSSPVVMRNGSLRYFAACQEPMPKLRL